MSKLLDYWDRAITRLFPTVRMQVLAMVLAGGFVGLSAYLVYVSKAYSYLSDDPEVCINCHVMGPYYATWQHTHTHASLHATTAMYRTRASWPSTTSKLRTVYGTLPSLRSVASLSVCKPSQMRRPSSMPTVSVATTNSTRSLYALGI